MHSSETSSKLQLKLLLLSSFCILAGHGSSGYDRLSLAIGGDTVEDNRHHQPGLVVGHEELLGLEKTTKSTSSSTESGLDQFSEEGVEGFWALLFDFARYQVVVGARDNLFRLSLEGLAVLERARWPASEKAVGMCKAKGRSEADCHNFVRVLKADRGDLLVCGTFAFYPQCSWRQAENLNNPEAKDLDGRGKCPYSPLTNATSVLAASGDLYVASSIDFSDNDHAVFMTSGLVPARRDQQQQQQPESSSGGSGSGSHQATAKTVRTAQYNSLWLWRPDFVASFEHGAFIYFVFREVAAEASGCGSKAVYSRLARICKNDRGGKVHFKETWTTFLKARLNCSVGGGSQTTTPFYFDEVQAATYVDEEETVYATFGTPENSIAGSAVCAFTLRGSVQAAFSGPFKTRERLDSIWTRARANNHSHFECQQDLDEVREVGVTSRDYQLLDLAVQPTTAPGPLYHEVGSRFTHIAVDVVKTKHDEDDGAVHVIFVTLRGSGVIKKFSYNSRTGTVCLVEVVHPFSDAAMPVKVNSLQFLSVSSSLYLATERSVVRIQVERCKRFRTKRACLDAMDPYCGWNSQTGACIAVPNKNPRASYWDQQGPLTCPVADYPVDGGWGPWSEWSTCQQIVADFEGPQQQYPNYGVVLGQTGGGDPSGQCQCRQRRCDSPSPANGGRLCEQQQQQQQQQQEADGFAGGQLQVANCTQHGKWTDWSAWSSCSNTCGIGMRERRRTCGNPAPAFGGRVCVGRDTDTQFCEDLPPCGVRSPPDNLNGGGGGGGVAAGSAITFSEWSDWSSCSSECGKGFRSRKRRCYGGSACSSSAGGADHHLCTSQYEECRAAAECPDQVDVTDFTPWVAVRKANKVKDDEDGSEAWTEQRFRIRYRAAGSSPGLVETSSNVKPLGGRVVKEERTCRKAGDTSECSASSSTSNDDVVDDGDPSSGAVVAAWTEWSKCTRECGGGYQIRLKRDSSSVMERPCNVQPCGAPSSSSSSAGSAETGPGEWSCWTGWSGCGGGRRTRTRECRGPVFDGHHLCQGSSSSSPQVEEADCSDDPSGRRRTGSWSECHPDLLVQTRYNVEDGGKLESRGCVVPEVEVEVDGGVRTTADHHLSAASAVAACFVCFALGMGLGSGLVYYTFRFRRGPGGLLGSPHYVSAKSQNLYVSLPMLDLKNNKVSSSTGPAFASSSTNHSDTFDTLRSTTSTLRSRAEGGSSIYRPSSDHETTTATIKRSHNSQRNSSLLLTGNLRADLDSDQLFN